MSVDKDRKYVWLLAALCVTIIVVMVALRIKEYFGRPVQPLPEIHTIEPTPVGEPDEEHQEEGVPG